MSNIDAATALFTSINFDRFAEIEARHAPDVTFESFRGPTLHNSVAVADWHRDFLERYADCTYGEFEFLEQDDTVAGRATIEAKGYDWRRFTQRVLEVLTFRGSEVASRRLYAMLRDVEFDKPETAAMKAAEGFEGGSPSTTASAVNTFYTAILAGDAEAAAAALNEKAVLIDSVYGVAAGPQGIVDLLLNTPRPAFGTWRVTRTLAGPKNASVELAIDPNRPRVADWVRIVDSTIMVIERYWMLREIGVDPYVEYSRDRHMRRVVMPI